MLRKKSKRPTKAKTVPESAIQADILTYLESTGLLYWRQNSGTLFFGKGRNRRKVRLGEKGLPDVIVVIPPDGRFLGLEVKSARGVWRPTQKDFCRKLQNAGGAYYVVRTLEQAVGALNQTLYEECGDGD